MQLIYYILNDNNDHINFDLILFQEFELFLLIIYFLLLIFQLLIFSLIFLFLHFQLFFFLIIFIFFILFNNFFKFLFNYFNFFGGILKKLSYLIYQIQKKHYLVFIYFNKVYNILFLSLDFIIKLFYN